MDRGVDQSGHVVPQLVVGDPGDLTPVDHADR
jgi:hypothetical protein